jgi:hypothetical protein
LTSIQPVLPLTSWEQGPSCVPRAPLDPLRPRQASIAPSRPPQLRLDVSRLAHCISALDRLGAAAEPALSQASGALSAPRGPSPTQQASGICSSLPEPRFPDILLCTPDSPPSSLAVHPLSMRARVCVSVCVLVCSPSSFFAVHPLSMRLFGIAEYATEYATFWRRRGP